jgi:preprotein translocase subunit SecF
MSIPSSLEIREHRPWLCPLLLAITISTMIIMGWFLYQNIVQHSLDITHQKNVELTLENQKLRKQVAALSLAVQMDQKTSVDVRQILRKLQIQNRELSEELGFYQNLSATADNEQSTVNVKSVKLSQNGQRYTYKIVLTQLAKNAKVAKGTVAIEIEGSLNNKTKRLTMKEITSQSSAAYELKYFARIEGELELPEAFVPKQVIINIFSEGQRKPKENRFNWKDIS